MPNTKTKKQVFGFQGESFFIDPSPRIACHSEQECAKDLYRSKNSVFFNEKSLSQYIEEEYKLITKKDYVSDDGDHANKIEFLKYIWKKHLLKDISERDKDTFIKYFFQYFHQNAIFNEVSSAFHNRVLGITKNPKYIMHDSFINELKFIAVGQSVHVYATGKLICIWNPEDMGKALEKAGDGKYLIKGVTAEVISLDKTGNCQATMKRVVVESYSKKANEILLTPEEQRIKAVRVNGKDKNGYELNKYHTEQVGKIKYLPQEEIGSDYQEIEQIAELLPCDMSVYPYPPRPKKGGANKPGEDGGRYTYSYSVLDEKHAEDEQKSVTVLFKQDTGKSLITRKKVIHHEKNIAEYVSSRIMKTLIGDTAATVFYATRPVKVDGTEIAVKIPDESGDNVYIGSVFYRDHYRDLFEEIYHILGLEPPKERPKAVETGLDLFERKRLKNKSEKMLKLHEKWEKIGGQISGEYEKNIIESLENNALKLKDLCNRLNLSPEQLKKLGSGMLLKKIFIDGMLSDDKSKCRFENFEKVTVGSLLVGDFDVHSGNYGVIGADGTQKKLVRIDQGAALENIDLAADDGDLHPHSAWRHPPIFGPTNHFREYPRKLTLTLEFANELERQASVSLSETIKDAIKETDKFYGIFPLIKFANRMSGAPGVQNKLPGVLSYKEMVIDKKWETIAKQWLDIIATSKKMQDIEAAKIKLSELKQQVVARITDKLDEFIKVRQRSLIKYALEIKLSLCFKIEEEKVEPSAAEINGKIDEVIRGLIAEYYIKNDKTSLENLRSGKIKLRLPPTVQGVDKKAFKGAMQDILAAKMLEYETELNVLIGPPAVKEVTVSLKSVEIQSIKLFEKNKFVNPLTFSQLTKSSHVMFFSHPENDVRKNWFSKKPVTDIPHFADYSVVYNIPSDKTFLQSVLEKISTLEGCTVPVGKHQVIARMEAQSARETKVFRNDNKFRLSQFSIDNGEKVYWAERYDNKQKKVISEVLKSNILDPLTIIAKKIYQCASDHQLDELEILARLKRTRKHPNELIDEKWIKKFLSADSSGSIVIDEMAQRVYGEYRAEVTQTICHKVGNKEINYVFPNSDLISLAIRQLNGFIAARGGQPSDSFSLTIAKEPEYARAMLLICEVRNKFMKKDTQKLICNNKTGHYPECYLHPEDKENELCAFIKLFETNKLKALVADIVNYPKAPVIENPKLGA